MPNIGPFELLIILVLALLILGPGKLPDVGAALGKTIREFRKASSEMQDSLRVEPSTTSTFPANVPANTAVATPAPAPAPVSQPADATQVSAEEHIRMLEARLAALEKERLPGGDQSQPTVSEQAASEH